MPTGKKALTGNTQRRVNNVELLMFQASKLGKTKELELVLELPKAEKTINYQDQYGHTPLMIAAKNGHLDCVKLLLGRGASFKVTTHRGGQEVTAWQLAKKANHSKMAAYLEKCLADIEKTGKTRAQLEAVVDRIASSPHSSPGELELFSSSLHQLIKHCDYTLNGHCSPDGDTHVPLLIRATKSDNVKIVLMLIHDFKATPLINESGTGYNILHLACLHRSDLRYYIVKHYPHLLRNPDSNGSVPLHLACANNDLDFVKWLFGKILAEESEMDRFCVQCEATMKRSNSLPDITTGRAVRRSSVSSHKKMSGQSDLGLPINILSPVASLPPFRPTHRRVKSGGNLDVIDSSSDSRESSPLTMREVGLMFSFDGSTRSNTVSLSCSSASRGSSHWGTPSSSIENSSESRGLRDSLDSRELSDVTKGSRESSANPEGEGREDATPLPPVEGCGVQTNGHTHSEEPELLGIEKILCESPLSVSEVLEMRPFRVDTHGDTILHILPRKGHTELLANMLKVADYIKRSVDFSFMVHRESHSARLPLEEAIAARSPHCMRLLINFSIVSGLFEDLLSDTLILKNSVFSSDIEVVKVLLEFGFMAGLGPAIALAMVNEYRHILRVLLYYHTQVVNSVEFTRVRRNGQVTLDKGGINWDGLQLEQLDPVWLYDSYDAVDSVSRALDLEPVLLTPEGNTPFYCRLGQDCLRFFKDRLPTAQSPRQLTMITEINISGSLLSEVPCELFQMNSLQVLKLTQNELTSLPSSKNLHETLYTSPIQRLELDWNKLESLPEDLFRGVALSLEELSAQCNLLKDLPPGLWVCPKLKTIKLSRNKLSRLHHLSDPRYFIDLDLTKQVSGCFTVERGELICTVYDPGPARRKELARTEQYIRDLASYYLTALAAQNAPPTDRDIYQEIISMHVARHVYYLHSEEGSEVTNSAPPTYRNTQLLLPGEEEDELEPKSMSCLETLNLSMNRFKEVPWDLACIAPQLSKLEFTGNQLTDCDIIHSMPMGIKSLILNDNKIVELERHRSVSLPCGDPLRLLTLPEENFGNKFCRHSRHEVLNSLTNLSLDNNSLESLPVVDIITDCTHDLEFQVAFDIGTVNYLVFYPNLSILSLDHNKFVRVPQHLHHLTHLSSLSLSHNDIHELPSEMGLINSQQLLLLKLEGLFLKNIPDNLLNRPTPKHLLSYLKALLQKSKPYRRIKLMVVGDANKGKTSLLLNLTKKGRIHRLKDVAMGFNNVPLATVGVDLGDWEYAPNPKKPKVTFMTWDFGGQAEYYATHQCFLTKRSLYVLVWDVQDGEAGLLKLQPWLENIEGRAPESPVFVIATHIDKLPPETRTDRMNRLRQRFKELYIDYSNSVYMYPRIHPQCLFVNCYDSKHMDILRELLYDYVIQYKPPAPRHLIAEMDPLLEQPIPASYIVLEDIVRSLANQCRQRKTNPIYTKQDFITAVKDHEAGYYEKLEELEQATHFLHDNGILLHYEDSSLLSDLYFVDPQWLCSMLAKVVTVQEKNPFQKNGFMPVDNLRKIFPSFVDEFIMLMQRFEVVLLLDKRRMLIPSLLPSNEEDSIVVFLRSVSDNLLDKKLSQQKSESPEAEEEDNIPGTQDIPHAPLCQTPYSIFSRYYFLPFVPNGFFTRVIARLMSTDIMDCLHDSLTRSQLEEDHLLNAAHWRCWQDGISIIWNHMEIFRIAPVRYPLVGTPSTILVSNSGDREVQTAKGVEIKAAILPEETVTRCAMIPDGDSEEECFKGRCVATWLLHQAVTVVDSVFEDWYEVFSKKKGFELSAIRTGSPCKSCYRVVQAAEVKAMTTPLQRRLSTFSMSFDVINRWSTDPLHLFSSALCSHALDKGFSLQCPLHGDVTVAEVAPDLVFSDFPSCKVFTDSSAVIIKRALGDGGFGTVFKATLQRRNELLSVAVKQFRTEMVYFDQDPKCLAELKSWDMYQKASQEGRVMLPLRHPNILGLIGLTFQPVRLIVELAPMGDLKCCVKSFKKAKVRLSRTTIQQTLIQTAEGLKYLHSKHFIYRDLKPDNILVWQFPTPETQWSPQSCVCIKIADYGISKQVTPQGIRGVEGTRPYLAPEVILHGGREAYSTLMDVYAFGMFMYYLTSFMTPFENETRPITALLEEGRRPELPHKLRPHSLHMFELMCWCWSDLPQHRPNFEQILSILKCDSFTSLLAATSLTRESNDITAASLHTICTRRNSITNYHSRSVANSSIYAGGPMNIDLSMTYSNVVSLMTGTVGEELTTQVWYGTESGACGVVQFQRGGTIKEDITLPAKKKKFVSSVAVVDKNVWFGTIGAGLWVYSSTSRQPVATWGEEGRQSVYTLLEIKDTSTVLVLTRKGMYTFNSDIGPTSPLYVTLYPTATIPKTGLRELNLGIVIPSGGNMEHTEVWVCSQSVLGFCILDPKSLSVLEEVKPPATEGQSHKIRHVTTIMSRERRVLVVADRHFLQFWDVGTRRKGEELDCVHACNAVYSENNTRNSRVTSLLSGGDFLYVGTGGGAILILDYVTMTTHKLFHAYSKPVRSLLLIQPDSQSPPVFKRLFSRKDSNPIKNRFINRPPSKHSLKSVSSTSSMQSTDDGSSDRAVLVSMGLTYRGVTGEAENHHSVFILPSEGSKVNTKLAKIPDHHGHLLLWSTETHSTGATDDTQECVCSELPNLEEEMDDSMFESGD